MQQDLRVDGVRSARGVRHISSLAILERVHKKTIVGELERRTINRKRLQMSQVTAIDNLFKIISLYLLTTVKSFGCFYAQKCWPRKLEWSLPWSTVAMRIPQTFHEGCTGFWWASNASTRGTVEEATAKENADTNGK